MDQYAMPKKLDFKNLRKCIDNYEADFLYIGLKGSFGGIVKVHENLEGKTLNFKKDNSGLYMLIDSKEVFHFPLEDYTKGFSLAYERVYPPEREGDVEQIVILYGEIDPYDSKFPEPRRSSLRIVLDRHLMEIYFKGRIPIKFHSWWNKPYWKYWTIVDKKPSKPL